MTTGIYAIINKIDGKSYIGSATKSFNHRWYNHKYYLRLNKHHSPYLQRAWNKYGGDSFEFKILEIIPKEEWIYNKYVTDFEQIYLDTYQPEYNICPTAGSKIGYKHSEETKKKIGNSNKGKTRSEEARKRFSESYKGKSPSLETREKIRLANTGRIKSEEERKKLSIANSKKKWVVTSSLMEEQIVTSLSAFCRENNISVSCLHRVAQGKRNHHKGWKCRPFGGEV
ncbi:group I intron endonuclease [Nostoc sp. PCC 7524]|uniref:NUMOD3 domain-containing DNA-binding protein n=1 Tax=Nostoc sp. (strain ATCC 29411 / PCC 7524) TaxID=28072 RepID=UPI00029F46CB|nr:NUMOD3 domain-containing DNA-binding protein [Nostoc sp. PCC 7524]AFY49019.1 group I intron endonuclease [Nostoc sp. PCC 7524]